MSTHTPGPWDVPPLQRRIVCSAQGAIADCDMSAVRTREQNEANARLIAAAPDLLEALELVWNKVLTECHSPDSYVRQRAEAAIAKAKGETA